MSRIPQLSACPSCEEPLEPADHFCGACGFDLSSVPEPPSGRPGAGPPPLKHPGEQQHQHPREGHHQQPHP
ncbi:serine/threonine-protein phosphatase, partial [Streptomyces sp. Vc17.3-30]|nr:serine/threonine-protein phosphatase [Streptomyces sp. Vc17.3-30]